MKQELIDLLLELFDAGELRRLIDSNFDTTVTARLPGGTAHPAEIAAAVVNVLQREGLVAPKLFDVLRSARKHQHAMIAAMEASWERWASAQPRAKSSVTQGVSTFRWLDDETLRRIYQTALAAGLATNLEDLTAGIDARYVASFATGSAPNARMFTMLQRMNSVRRLVDGSVPLAQWLANAEMLLFGQEAAEVFATAREHLGHDAGA